MTGDRSYQLRPDQPTQVKASGDESRPETAELQPVVGKPARTWRDTLETFIIMGGLVAITWIIVSAFK